MFVLANQPSLSDGEAGALENIVESPKDKTQQMGLLNAASAKHLNLQCIELRVG